MRWYHVIVLAAVTFCWIWALPLLFVGALFSVPACVAALPACFLISIMCQWRLHDQRVTSSWLRQMAAVVPWHAWFPCNVLEIPKEPCIIAVHPHGVLCCAAVVGIHLVQGSQTVFCVAPALFYVPVFGWFARLMGCIPATWDAMRSALDAGYPLIVVPGGVPELVLAECCDDKRFFLEKRFGFVKLAMVTSVPLFPVWARGETATYRLVRGPWLEQRVWLSWKLNIPFVLPWFRGWYNLWIPRRVPLELTHGTFLRTDAECTRSSLADFKQKYATELRRLIT